MGTKLKSETNLSHIQQMRCLGLPALSSIEGSGEPKQMRRLARTFLAENSASSSAGFVEGFCHFAISTKISWQNIVLSLNTHFILSLRCGSASCFGFLDQNFQILVGLG